MTKKPARPTNSGCAAQGKCWFAKPVVNKIMRMGEPAPSTRISARCSAACACLDDPDEKESRKMLFVCRWFYPEGTQPAGMERFLAFVRGGDASAESSQPPVMDFEEDASGMKGKVMFEAQKRKRAATLSARVSALDREWSAAERQHVRDRFYQKGAKGQSASEPAVGRSAQNSALLRKVERQPSGM